MIQLSFEGPSLAHTVTLGPAPWFRIGGHYIRQGPHGVIVGTYRHHQWEINASYFHRFDCQDRSVAHFEDAGGGPTEDFGPFAMCYATDGVMYADDTLFAKFIEESHLWHCYVTETFWLVMIVKPAPCASQRGAVPRDEGLGRRLHQSPRKGGW